MFRDANLLRLVPDLPGKGGVKSSLHTHPSDSALDTWDTYNVYLWLNRWRQDVQALPVTGLTNDTTAARSESLHAFLRFDTTDPSLPPVTTILGHNTDSLGAGRIWDYSSGSLLLGVASTSVPATFSNIKNRCFFCYGTGPVQIYDGSIVYEAGVEAPAAALLYTSPFPGSVTVTAFVRQGSVFVVDDGTSFQVTDVGKYITISGQPFLITTYADDGGGAFPGGGTASGFLGSNQVTISGAVWPADQAYAGLILDLGAEAHRIASYTTTGADTFVTLQSNLTALFPPGSPYSVKGRRFQLSTAYAGPSYWAITATIGRGVLSWVGTGPQYAYAYYDPTTGHIGNVSPLTQITEQDQAGVNVTLTGFVPPINPGRFSQYKIFRTFLSGGSILLVIATVPVATVTWTDSYPDTVLTAAGDLQAPLLTNRPPPQFAHMLFWDGRVWGSPTSDPSGIYFSADAVQVTFGVPEECFPSGNLLRIPAADGRVTGMQMVGDRMVITTERYAYYVTGYNEQNYRLLRYSTTMYGVGDYQMSPIAGDTVESADAVAYLGRDSRVYVLQPGSANQAVSAHVQQELATALSSRDKYQRARLHTFSVGGRKGILVCAGTYVYLFDLERQVWTKSRTNARTTGITPEALCTVYGGTVPVQELFARTGYVRAWLRPDLNTPTNDLQRPFVRTFPLDFNAKKSRKSINFVRIYTNQGAVTVPWQVVVGINETNYYTADAVELPDPVRSELPPGAVPLDNPNAKELVAFPSGALVDADSSTWASPWEGFRFDVKVVWPSDLPTPGEVYSLEICWSLLEVPNEQADV